MRELDFYFVLPVLDSSRPPGGYNIVYDLSKGLIAEGYGVGIGYLIDPFLFYESRIGNKFKQSRGTGFVKRLSGIRNFGNLFFFYKTKYGKYFKNNDYDYSAIKGAIIEIICDPNSLNERSKNYIASSWETANIVYGASERNNSKGWYLIQNFEDDPVISGSNAHFASETYALPLRKIVINNSMERRFLNESPGRLNISLNLNLFKRMNSIRKEIAVITILRKDESKGAKYAIEALKKIRETKSEVRLIAFGNLEAENVPEWIEYHKSPSDREVANLYNRATIFLFASLIEGFPAPPLEAMACGCAVVATINGGCEDYIKDNENGFLCQPKDPDCLAQKALLLLNDIEKLQDVKNLGVETTKKYTSEEMRKQFLSIVLSENVRSSA